MGGDRTFSDGERGAARVTGVAARPRTAVAMKGKQNVKKGTPAVTSFKGKRRGFIEWGHSPVQKEHRVACEFAYLKEQKKETGWLRERGEPGVFQLHGRRRGDLSGEEKADLPDRAETAQRKPRAERFAYISTSGRVWIAGRGKKNPGRGVPAKRRTIAPDLAKAEMGPRRAAFAQKATSPEGKWKKDLKTAGRRTIIGSPERQEMPGHQKWRETNVRNGETEIQIQVHEENRGKRGPEPRGKKKGGAILRETEVRAAQQSRKKTRKESCAKK